MTAPDPADTVIERAARAMHDAYEAAAVQEGWETQRRSRVAWEDVPEANKRTMYAALRALHDAGLLADPADRDRCHVAGCVEHVDGMHVDRAGDAIVHPPCADCYDQLLQQRDNAEAEVAELRADYAALVNSQLLIRYGELGTRLVRAEAEVARLRKLVEELGGTA